MFSTIRFVAAGILSLAATAVTVYFIYIVSIYAFDQGRELGALLVEDREPRRVEITISNPTTLDEMSRILYERDIISSPLLFRIENTLQGNTAIFQPGTFLVSSEMSAAQLSGALRATGFFTDVQIRIAEGSTNADIAAYLENLEIMSSEEFLEVANNVSFDFSFIRDIPERSNPLQGYLFPDTYMIPANATPQQIIARQLQRFEDIFDFDMYMQASELGFSMDEVVIMASIIERETRISPNTIDRNKYAAIIQNRLRLEMPLEMPSTVAYALDRPVTLLTPADFEVDSPHNTFNRIGLPYGPISNPSAASIRAVLYPYPAEYLYALLVDIETGEKFFTPYLEEYQQKQAEIAEVAETAS